jgi:HEPN domain-containing protein
MQRDRFLAADIWLANAEIDLQVAAELVERFPSRACFHARQAAELVLKAALIALTDDHPRAHTGGVLIGEIQTLGRDVPAEIAAVANRLDLFYMGSRYPDALGGADPSKVLQKSDALLAIEQARSVVGYARDLISQLRVENAPEE